MRKKDYELIGSAFRYGATIPTGENQLYWVADILATKLAKAYPKFDRQKFLTACGIETRAYKPANPYEGSEMSFQDWRSENDHE